MRTHARVVVIGGGVVGVSTLYHLVKKGLSDSVLIERRELTSGSTWHAAGLLPLFNLSYSVGQIHKYSVALYKRLAAETGLNVGLAQVSNIRLARTQDRLEEYKYYAGVAATIGVDVKFLTPRQVKEVWPLCEVDDLIGAIQHPEDGYIQPADLTQALARGARNGGGEINRNTVVTAIEKTASGEWKVVTDKGDISAPIVIAATGPWSRPLFEYVGYALPIEAELHQVAILKNAPTMKGGGCACIDSVTETYFRSDAYDKFLVGDFWGERPVNPDNFPQRAADASLEEMIERTCGRIPKLENAEVMRGVTGVYDMTPDSRPLLGQIPEIAGLYVCAGFSGMGFKISPAIGLVMSELLLDGRGKTVDIHAFRPNRFAENQPIQSEYEYVDDTY